LYDTGRIENEGTKGDTQENKEQNDLVIKKLRGKGNKHRYSKVISENSINFFKIMKLS
jgi:hypothetical protein